MYDGFNLIETHRGPQVTRFVHGAGVDEHIALFGGGPPLYYVQDVLGNVVALTAVDGSAVEAYLYQAYGSPTVVRPGGNGVLDWGIDDEVVSEWEAWESASLFGNPFLFTGQPFDADVGLYYYRARYYDPAEGRFLSRDPIGVWGDTSSLGNAYAYVGNSPLSMVDPSGLARCGLFEMVCNAGLDVLDVVAIVGAGAAGLSCVSSAVIIATGTTSQCQGFRDFMEERATAIRMRHGNVDCVWSDAYFCHPECARGDLLCEAMGDASDCVQDHRAVVITSCAVVGTAIVLAGCINVSVACVSGVGAAASRVAQGVSAGGVAISRLFQRSPALPANAIHAGGRTFQITGHAATQMVERKIGREALVGALEQKPFNYMHEGITKQGYFNPATNTFAATVEQRITTVMQGSGVPRYLQAKGWWSP